ncbi:MAG: DUF5652 family protein, partial [Parcubacteria group bacterium]
MTLSTFNQIQTLFLEHPVFTTILILWSFVWKGLALWKSAQLRQRNWFIAILVINIFGILEIIYLYFIA